MTSCLFPMGTIGLHIGSTRDNLYGEKDDYTVTDCLQLMKIIYSDGFKFKEA